MKFHLTSRRRRPCSTRRSLFGVMVLLSVGLAVSAGYGAGAAGNASAGESSSTSPRPQSYYLALGDSITYGFQPTKAAAGAPPSSFDTGYVDVFAARLRKLSPKIQVVNYGCPGESTVTFARGGCPAFADGIKLHDAFRGSQINAAVSFLRAHPGEVGTITVSLFGNDWFPILESCKGNVGCIRKRAPSATASFGLRLNSILRRLRAAAPTADIVVTGAWNPDPSALEQLASIYRALDASIARAAAPSRAHVAKTLPVFNPTGDVRAQRTRLCALTFICSKGDPHPTDAGYRAIADAVAAALR
jgi:lysophospholipase L1-like esterase